MAEFNPIKITNSADGKVAEITIEGTIGGDYDWWTGELIGGATKEALREELKNISAIQAEKIIVNINSYGGDVNHGMSMHDLLAQNPAKKEVRINGMTASAATIVAMAGDIITMSDNALFLAHLASTIAVGNKKDIKMSLDDLEIIDNRIVNVYKKRTKRAAKDITSLMEVNNGNGKWLTAIEAKDFGFVDEVFEPRKIAAKFDNTILKKFNLPELPTMETDKKTLAEKISQGIKDYFKKEKGEELKISNEVTKLIDDKAQELENSFVTAQTEANKELVTAHETALNAEKSKVKDLENKIIDMESKKVLLEGEIEKLKLGGGTQVKSTGDPNPSGEPKKVDIKEQIAREIFASIPDSEKQLYQTKN